VNIRTCPDRVTLGHEAAADIADFIRSRLAAQAGVRIVFAAAPSQQETLEELAAAPAIDWSRVSAFHMDDYLGLPDDAPQRFGTWLRRVLFDRVPFGTVHLMRTDGDPEARCKEYADLLAEAPIDAVCLGIGVNGHIAFNDPPYVDFADPLAVKVVELDRVSRQQQVDEGHFPTFDDVPAQAITLTVPRLLDADKLFCMVPGAAKAPAVRRTIHDQITTDCASTILREHKDCTLYLDADSASELN
jgi:glucosamine-6-phosphate deaminase